VEPVLAFVNVMPSGDPPAVRCVATACVFAALSFPAFLACFAAMPHARSGGQRGLLCVLGLLCQPLGFALFRLVLGHNYEPGIFVGTYEYGLGADGLFLTVVYACLCVVALGLAVGARAWLAKTFGRAPGRVARLVLVWGYAASSMAPLVIIGRTVLLHY